MKNKKGPSPSTTAPQFSQSEPLLELHDLEFVSDADYGNFKLSDCDLMDTSATDSVIECAQFARVGLTGTTFASCRLTDVRLDGCDASNAAWTECKLTRLEFVDCKFTGIKLIDNQMNNILFEKCVGKLAQMCGSNFKRVTFSECHFAGIDFSDCIFEECTFNKCDLRNAIFYNAKVAGTDFRTSELFGLKCYAPDLSGAVIERHQALELAPQLAGLLGIEIKED